MKRTTRDKKDKRLSTRCRVQRTGRALKFVWRECTIEDMGKKGLGIRIHNSEKMSTGSTVYLEIHDPEELEPLCLKGIVKWIEQDGNDCVSGIELDQQLEGCAWVALRGPFTYQPPKRVF